MANEGFILRKESQCEDMVEEIKLTIRAIQRELDNNNGELYSENKDCWNALHDSAYELQGYLANLLETLGRSL